LKSQTHLSSILQSSRFEDLGHLSHEINGVDHFGTPDSEVLKIQPFPSLDFIQRL
jgi:hypothetical protein